MKTYTHEDRPGTYMGFTDTALCNNSQLRMLVKEHGNIFPVLGYANGTADPRDVELRLPPRPGFYQGLRHWFGSSLLEPKRLGVS